MNRARMIFDNEELAIRLWLILMLIGGIFLSVLIPPWQTPDEYSHLNYIGLSLKNDALAENFLQDMELDQNRIRFQYDEKVDESAWEEAIYKAPGYDRLECLPKGITPSVLKHLPSAVGISLGVLFHLPTFWVLELGELFSLLFYIGICWMAVRIMPYHKEILLMFMGFPMSLQQAASINYDAVLLPFCFLYIAYIFYMRCKKDKLGWMDVLRTVLLLVAITYVKLPYVFMGLLVLLLPKEKIHLKIGRYEINGECIKKWRIPIAILLIIGVFAGIYVFRSNYWLKLVAGMFAEWRRTLFLFRATLQNCGKMLLISSVGQFGWLESALPFAFVVATYLLLVGLAVCGSRKAGSSGLQLRMRTRIYICMVFIILSTFVMMSMVNHTVTVVVYGGETMSIDYNIREALYQISYIGGLQGRYFLPFLPLLFLSISDCRRNEIGKLWIVDGYMVVAVTVAVTVLFRRYWA